jgi:NAD(P)-dependent dehydrogenase (short-subunit alcohol dehydrogenase family)
VFVTSGLSWLAKAYCGPYAATKAALNVLAQTYAAESDSSNVRVNLFNPGPTRTKLYASGWPGVDPATLNAPEAVAKAVVSLCLPGFTETGKVFDFVYGALHDFRPPAKTPA